MPKILGIAGAVLFIMVAVVVTFICIRYRQSFSKRSNVPPEIM
jgi:hypothetical protein